MAYLAKSRRQDLLELAETLDISIQDNFKILDIKDAILKSEGYDAEFTCECLNRIISDRKELELRAEREKENRRQFELQKLQCNSTTADSNMPKRNPISKDRIPEKKIVDTKEDRTPVSCYGCGAPGIIRSRCHTCNPVRQNDDALSSSLNQSNFYSFSSESKPISIIQISICNTEAAVCAYTGATHSVAGEKLYHLLKQKGLNFEEKTMQMTLADGRTQTTEILTTSVDISIQGKVIPTELLILKNARGNRTLLGIDFLTAAGIVLDLQRKQWYFTETSHRKYNFVKAPPNINALLTVDPKPHLCQLRKNEGTHLSLPQREELNSLLEKYEECFQLGGEPTPFIEHRINTRNHLPVAVPPYRMNPSKKEILKQEIDRLLSEGIIEECESPYASAVVLIPKPNGTFRLCIDYRKLNEITVADTYPLPRMDDLLHQAKLTPFMSTLDLRAGYHQVKVHVEDQDKTAFVCPFGTYRFLRMPYGIEVDPEKVASILDIPPPKNVKELQSFLQTCSWFRRYIQDFAKISRPLSYLTKKKVKWQWEFDQQNAFQTLKNSLTTPPVLKQADGTKPYIIRTDASNYALGAVLLQGEGSDEHPIEYASRLLTPAERNYSTTEREALAVVWALKKFRGYIEGTEITVASDHQPLKWLLNLKSPTGRLARWALEIQSFNLKVQYIPGKANVVADMLSRPVTQEEESFCEENNITIADMPTRSCKDMREAQLKDDNLKKIIDSF
ncbi:retrovirus-related Pol polyprotein from transposon 17.6 [Trichonephila clavipes]|uniref:RNA-directed DNA polymerase n=1 Tax=Trichonephila clavipes TaxID=2585209 RepID=A0A8X6S0B7_TRICX|nr:retrovirus-related Pol polyprotein from transposon 17.6 [Trichonephila clavipes]